MNNQNNQKQKTILPTIIFAALFVFVLAAGSLIDVKPAGPDETRIGLSTINLAIENLICPTAPTLSGGNLIWYYLSEVTGVIALLVAALFAALGVLELVQRKSVVKVDKEILALGALYILTMIFYALFEVIVINYRPVIMPDETAVEASFPSSHTMLAIVIFGSAVPMFYRYIRSERLQKILHIACLILLAVTICARLLSGVHWLTDILAGSFLALALLSLFLRQLAH